MSRDEKQAKKPANNNNLKIGRKAAVGLIARQMMGLPPMHGSGKLIGPWGQLSPGLGLAAEMMDLQAQPPKQQNTQMVNPFFGPALGLMSSQGQMMGPRMPMRGGGGFTPGYDPWSLQIGRT